MLLLSETIIMVKRRYLPMSGRTMLVAGMISVSKRKKTVSETRIEMHSVIFSPLSDGR